MTNMSKVITFSRTFPAYHKKAGQPTFFVEQIFNSIYAARGVWGEYTDAIADLDTSILGSKHHTIRRGNRWKAGDKFSPRIWSGKPYKSKQLIISDDIEIVKVLQVKIVVPIWYVDGVQITTDEIIKVGENDGLLYDDLLSWFQKPFTGQIICWSDPYKLTK